MAYRDSTRHQCNADGKVAAAILIWSRHQLPDWLDIWAGCLRRIHAWRVPPHWSARDWSEEMQAHCAAAAVQAVFEYDGTRGVPLGSFVRWRMMAGALTRSRQEWAYALRYPADPDRPDGFIGDAPPPRRGSRVGAIRTDLAARLRPLADRAPVLGRLDGGGSRLGVGD
jgi:hypothetical protein